MKVLLVQNARELRITEQPDPEATDTTVVAETRLTSVLTEQVGIWSGSDPRVRSENKEHPLYRGGFPFPLRGEWTGEVVRVGRSVKDLKPGDRIAGYAAFQSLNQISPESVVKVPNTLHYEEAISIAYAAHGLHCIHRAEIKVGDNVVVVGQGPMGLGATQWAAIAGAGQVIAVDRFDKRLRVAQQVGATSVVNAGAADARKAVLDLTDGSGGDIVINAAHSPEAFEFCMRLAREKGKVVVLSWHTRPIVIEDITEDFYHKELEIISSRSMGAPDSVRSAYVRWTRGGLFSLVVKMMVQGRYTARPFITHRFRYDRAEEALTTVEKEQAEVVKTVLEW